MSRGWIRSACLMLLLAMQPAARAATCSCAGVPLLAFIDTSATEKGQLFISYVIESHEISDLVSGSDDVPDETGRDRHTSSQVLTGSYALTDRWAVSALVSYVEHSRVINTSFLGGTRTSGLSDSVIMARYTPLYITPFSRHELSLGLGVRIPTGDDNAGGLFVVSEDMQPSTGAFGTILWAHYGYAFNQADTLRLNVSTNYTANEENDRQYAFGDEFNLALAFNQSIGPGFDYSVGLRYRTTEADTRFGFNIPNTGGEWLDFIPAVAYSLTDRLNIGLSGRIPVARNLDGELQFTTSYSYSISMTYGF